MRTKFGSDEEARLFEEAAKDYHFNVDGQSIDMPPPSINTLNQHPIEEKKKKGTKRSTAEATTSKRKMIQSSLQEQQQQLEEAVTDLNKQIDFDSLEFVEAVLQEESQRF